MNLFSGLGSDDEVKLVNDLFEISGYNPLIRPVKNVNDNLTVQFNLALSQLINIVSSLVYGLFFTSIMHMVPE